jgi:hypothetical protein
MCPASKWTELDFRTDRLAVQSSNAVHDVFGHTKLKIFIKIRAESKKLTVCHREITAAGSYEQGRGENADDHEAFRPKKTRVPSGLSHPITAQKLRDPSAPGLAAI